jgi:hypothetical protein
LEGGFEKDSCDSGEIFKKVLWIPKFEANEVADLGLRRDDRRCEANDPQPVCHFMVSGVSRILL